MCTTLFWIDVIKMPFAVVTDLVAKVQGFIDSGFLVERHGFLW